MNKTEKALLERAVRGYFSVTWMRYSTGDEPDRCVELPIEGLTVQEITEYWKVQASELKRIYEEKSYRSGMIKTAKANNFPLA